jgi:hypothetical protein
MLVLIEMLYAILDEACSLDARDGSGFNEFQNKMLRAMLGGN